MSKYNNLCPTQYVEEDQNVGEHPDYRETGAEELTALRSQLADARTQVEELKAKLSANDSDWQDDVRTMHALADDLENAVAQVAGLKTVNHNLAKSLDARRRLEGIVDWQDRAEAAEKNNVWLNNEYAKVEAQVERLRAVLKMVEWIPLDTAPDWCPWCQGYVHEGHFPDCPRQAALNSKEA